MKLTFYICQKQEKQKLKTVMRIAFFADGREGRLHRDIRGCFVSYHI